MGEILDAVYSLLTIVQSIVIQPGNYYVHTSRLPLRKDMSAAPFLYETGYLLKY